MNKYAVCILTYGRAENLDTYNTLRKKWYKWKVYLILSSDDDKIDDYRNKFIKEKNVEIIVFDKKKYRRKFDIWDNFYDDKKDKVVVYARNAVFDLIKEKWEKYFLVLDDDYIDFSIRYPDNNKLLRKKIKDINNIFEIFFTFLDNNKNVDCIAFAQDWDYIWWVQNRFFKKEWYQWIKRKIMNVFFCDVDRKFEFMWRINEDVNCYTDNWKRWKIFLTNPLISVQQKITQSNKWWLTDIYLNLWTYVKSSYTILFNPSTTKIWLMWNKDKRIHHNIIWKYAVPYIIEEKYKK